MKKTENEIEIEFDEFDITEIKHDTVCLIIGKRRSGKSYLLRNIMYHLKSIPVGTCISGTERANKFFGFFMPKRFIHTRLSMRAIESTFKRQVDIKRALKKEKNREIASKIDPRAFLILDDCLYDKSWSKTEIVREIFMNGRHYDLMFLITMQYPLGIPPELRTNVDYVFIFREPSIGNRKRIYDNYASIIPNFQLFNIIMDTFTENHECIVIKSVCDSNKLHEQVFWYKAKDEGEFRVGASTFWQDHVSDSDDDNEEKASNEKERMRDKSAQYKILRKH